MSARRQAGWRSMAKGLFLMVTSLAGLLAAVVVVAAAVLYRIGQMAAAAVVVAVVEGAAFYAAVAATLTAVVLALGVMLVLETPLPGVPFSPGARLILVVVAAWSALSGP